MNHLHEWVVFSTALQECCLMLQCVECGLMGTVDDPTKEEWSKAFHAPSRPYRWDDESRVRIQGPGAIHVVRADKDAKICDCPCRQTELKYERFPAEIMAPDAGIMPEDRQELEGLADLVGKSDLCSNLFPFFIRSYQDATGNEPGGAVKRIAGRIEQIDRMGLNFSPYVV